MNAKGIWTKSLLVLMGAVATFSPPVLAQTNHDRQSTTGPVASLVAAAERLLGQEDQSADPMKTIRLARALLYRVKDIEADDLLGPRPTHPLLEFGRQSSPESRRAYAMDILGTNLYSEMEKRFMKTLETSTNALERIASFQILSKGLASSRASEAIARELNATLRGLGDENITNRPQMRTEIFWAAESLCYLGQPDGLEIMSWALESKKTSPEEKVVAIAALETLRTREARETLLRSAGDLALSENPSVARNTFDALGRVPEFREIGTRAGLTQLERLKVLCETRDLNRVEWMLLSQVTGYFYGTQQRGQLSLDDQKRVKQIAVDIIGTGRERESETVVVLFGMMATDEDVSVIRELFQSKWPNVRRQSIWSVLNCSPEVRMKLVGDVVPLLDDPDSQNRWAALDVIRVSKGEKPMAVRSQEEFATTANRFRSWWDAEKKETSGRDR